MLFTSRSAGLCGDCGPLLASLELTWRKLPGRERLDGGRDSLVELFPILDYFAFASKGGDGRSPIAVDVALCARGDDRAILHELCSRMADVKWEIQCRV